MIRLQTYFMLGLHTSICIWNAISVAWCWTLFEEMKKETIVAGFRRDPQNSARFLHFPSEVIFRKTSCGFRIMESSCLDNFNETWWWFDNGIFYEDSLYRTKEKWIGSYRARLAFRKHRPFVMKIGL